MSPRSNRKPALGQRSTLIKHVTSMSYNLEPAIWSRDTGQRITWFDRCQLIITWCHLSKKWTVNQGYMSSMAAMLCDSDPPSSPSSSHAPASNTASHDNHEKINLRGSAWRPSAAGALLLLYCYLTIYAWIYENGAEKLNSRPKRAFFSRHWEKSTI